MTEILLIITAVVAIFTIGYVVGDFASKVNEHPSEKQEPLIDQTVVTAEVAPAVDLVIGDIDDDPAPAPAPEQKSPTFAERILGGTEQIKQYYVAIQDEFYTYRGINARISAKGVSYRLGRELVAKLYVRGKTLRLNLALSFSDFPENVYFQKDMSDIKTYQQIPFGIKIKSDRGLKNAIKLIAELSQKSNFDKKPVLLKKTLLLNLKNTFNNVC